MDIPVLSAEVISYAFGTIFVALVTAGVKFLHDLSKSVMTLNLNMATVLTELGHSKETIEDHEARLRIVEGCDAKA